MGLSDYLKYINYILIYDDDGTMPLSQICD
jgi:hypothetical protein